jgi:hypothetical protein
MFVVVDDFVLSPLALAAPPAISDAARTFLCVNVRAYSNHNDCSWPTVQRR